MADESQYGSIRKHREEIERVQRETETPVTKTPKPAQATTDAPKSVHPSVKVAIDAFEKQVKRSATQEEKDAIVLRKMRQE